MANASNVQFSQCSGALLRVGKKALLENFNVVVAQKRTVLEGYIRQAAFGVDLQDFHVFRTKSFRHENLPAAVEGYEALIKHRVVRRREKKAVELRLMAKGD